VVDGAVGYRDPTLNSLHNKEIKKQLFDRFVFSFFSSTLKGGRADRIVGPTLGYVESNLRLIRDILTMQ